MQCDEQLARPRQLVAPFLQPLLEPVARMLPERLDEGLQLLVLAARLHTRAHHIAGDQADNAPLHRVQPPHLARV